MRQLSGFTALFVGGFMGGLSVYRGIPDGLIVHQQWLFCGR